MTQTTNTESMNLVINASLLNALQGIHKGTFAHIEYNGDEKLPKYLGLGIVTKRTSGTIQLNYSYENAVNNRLEKQGEERTFEAQSLPWGQWFINNLIIAHKGESYLRFYTFSGASMTTQYFVDGRPATDEEVQAIQDYKASRSKGSKTQEGAGLEDNQVKPCNVNTKHIISLTCGKCQYHREETEVAAEVTR